MCIAYCEAQDNPLEIDLDDPSALSDLKAPARRILENYVKKMGDNDPYMPCVIPPKPALHGDCPLWTIQEINTIRNVYGYLGPDEGVYQNYEISLFDSVDDQGVISSIRAYAAIISVRYDDISLITGWRIHLSAVLNAIPDSAYENYTYEGHFSHNVDLSPDDRDYNIRREVSLTESEYDVCRQQLADAPNAIEY